MLRSLLKKDIKLIFTNKTNFALLLVLPIMLILVFGFALDNYMSGNYNTFDDGKVLYYEEDPSEEMQSKFAEISQLIAQKTGVIFEEINNYEEAKRKVEKSEAFAVVKITGDHFYYFRSSFNEPEGGEIVRSLFSELSTSLSETDVYVTHVTLDVDRPDSKVYYTFSGLALAIMMMASIIAGSYSKDRMSDTFDRIALSKAGKLKMAISKSIAGIICGVIQVTVALTVATLVFGIEWKNNFGYILLVHLALILFSTSIGSLIGMISKNASMSQTAVLLIAMLSGYLGGSITPVYLLENMPVVKYIVKVSPIYWTSQSLSNLYNGIVNDKTRNCLIVLLALSILFLTLSVKLSTKTAKDTGTDARQKNMQGGTEL